ncbi:uncharacterized protein LOC132759736 isoform X2 [Ruditapes philippinarum]|uniref:uncharacterized protein LOC132759736 isoform X2 n=1 Tax=Ruditapes philippinarum TaxID=129788 RepID=UPI00295AE772|nr:uncharacterized protein LOC132759736 isoform X2 [Ruditapes philippinarum]
MMMQQQNVDTNEPEKLKPDTATCEDGNILSLPSSSPSVLSLPSSSPSTPAALNRFPLVRTGRDSGYGTDYSPSPSSNTSSRQFVFNDDMVPGGNVSTRTRVEMIDLSHRLQDIHVDPKNNVDIGSDTEPESVLDEHDEEVRDINANNSDCNQFVSPEGEIIKRPSAPLPCLLNIATGGDQRSRESDGSTPAVLKPLKLRNTTPSEIALQNNSSNSASTVQVLSHTSVDHLSRDRSHSMPNVRALREQEVGRELRRLSDDFFNFHISRRRQRTLSVESSAFPLRFNINVYAGTTYTDVRTNNDTDTNEDETNNN